MVFLCQSDSYLKKTTTKLISCTESKKYANKFECEFEHALIFPEGGGQPSDHGTVYSGTEIATQIINAYRSGEKAISITENPLKPDVEYEIKLDFNRRFDHMQQHTGQHLISAVADKAPFEWNTSSWWLGAETCNVELDTPKVSLEQLKDLETRCNEIIRNSSSGVKVHVTDKNGADKLGAKTRGLPDDHVGDLRVVEFPGVDMNLCCGTHLKDLREVQMIKLLGFERGKKGKTCITFVCGDRVINQLQLAIEHQAALTAIFKGGRVDHASNAQNYINKMKLAERGLKTSLMDLAKLEIEAFKNLEKTPEVFELHRRDASFDYLNMFSKNLPAGQAAFMTVGDDKDKSCQFQFIVHSDKIEEIQDKILELIGGKGSAKNGRLQGKCANCVKDPP